MSRYPEGGYGSGDPYREDDPLAPARPSVDDWQDDPLRPAADPYALPPEPIPYAPLPPDDATPRFAPPSPHELPGRYVPPPVPVEPAPHAHRPGGDRHQDDRHQDDRRQDDDLAGGGGPADLMDWGGEDPTVEPEPWPPARTSRARPAGTSPRRAARRRRGPDRGTLLRSLVVVLVTLAVVGLVGSWLRGKPAPQPTTAVSVGIPSRGVSVRATRGPVEIAAAVAPNRLLFIGTLRRGAVKTFTEPVLILQVGDAGVADVFVDGRKHAPLGKAGQTVRVTLRS